MNGTDQQNEQNQGDASNDPRPVAFCQDCGKPLNRETVRVVGPAVYCEQCLAARLSGAAGATAASGTSDGYTHVHQGTGPANAGGAGGTGAGTAGGSWAGGWGAAASGPPNPGLAALLGLLPGVGAMYNEQYAKGIVHLAIFALLCSFTHASGIFLLFVFGWIFYMAIEAHHTAKARRDGTPLPNPFGLNDVGERMGFGRAWPAGADVAGAARDAAHAAGFRPATHWAAPPVAGGAPPVADPVAASSAASGAWGAPVNAYPPPAGYQQPFGAGAGTAGYGTGYGPTTPPYVPPYAAAYGAPVATGPVPLPNNRFPAGAIWLIGLGTIFLLGTTGIFNGLRGEALIGIVLMGLGAWVFVRRMDNGQGMASDGTPEYRLRLMRALRPAAWLGLLGLLMLLNGFNIVRWDYSWPWLLILAGVLALLNRLAQDAAARAAYLAGTYDSGAAGASTSTADHTEGD